MSRFIFKNRSQTKSLNGNSNNNDNIIASPTATDTDTATTYDEGNIAPSSETSTPDCRPHDSIKPKIYPANENQNAKARGNPQAIDLTIEARDQSNQVELRYDPNDDDEDEDEDYDDEEEEEEEEDEDYEEDVDDEENCDENDEDGDYCSDQSSTTSTSSTNNPTDNTRVCDCCYCEVFGHGVPPVAPTSRNYHEMRERLRLRLSKRRAEGCDKAHRETAKDDSSNDRGGGLGQKPAGDYIDGSPSPNSINAMGKQNSGPLVDQRNLDELLNYINGTSQKENDKFSARRKDKQQQNNSNKKNTNNSKKNIKDCNKSQNHSHKNQDHASPTRLTTTVANSPSTTNGKQKRKDKDKLTESSTNSCKHACCNTPNHKDQLNGKANSKTPNSSKKISTSAQNSKSAKANQHNQTHSITKVNNKKSSGNLNGNIKPNIRDQSLSKQHDQNSKKNAKHREDHVSSCSQNYDLNNLDLSDDSSKSFSPEDVFKPKDIDLNDDDLDELERELEAFKRFCFDSAPLVKKERVRVELKNWSSDRLQ